MPLPRMFPKVVIDSIHIRSPEVTDSSSGRAREIVAHWILIAICPTRSDVHYRHLEHRFIGVVDTNSVTGFDIQLVGQSVVISSMF